ncbi:MAG: RHS repeat-associated core domain-containing protein, partial [Planctomycetota bacterium]
VIAATDGRGDFYTTRYQYDGVGRLVETQQPTGTAEDPGPFAITRAVYANAGQTVTEIDPRGDDFATIRTFTVDRQIASANTFIGRTLNDTDRRLERWVYDAAGHLSAYVDPRGTDFQTEFIYDAAGLLYETSTVAGTIDEPRRIRQTFEYDESENQTRKVEYGGNDYVTNLEYNDLNYPAAIIDAAGDEIRWVVDRFGNPVETTDKFGTTIREFDRLDRPTRTVDGVGDETNVSYPDANTIVVRDGRGNETTTFNDGLGRLATLTDPLNGQTEYFYDEIGNLVTLIDAVGNTHSTTFDARSLPITQTVGVGSDAEALTTFEYDLLGRQIRQTDPRDPTGEFFAVETSYDGLGRVIETRRSAATPELTENVPFTPGFDQLVAQYFFDPIGNMVREIPEGGEAYAVDYVYNNVGQVVQTTRNTGTVDQPRESVTQMSYNDNGDLIELINPVGQRTTYQHDSLGRKIEERIHSEEAGGDIVRVWDFESTDNGPTITLTDELGSVATVMHFDEVGRVSREEVRGEPDRVLTYDASGNLESETIGNWSETHQYDARNHLSQTTDADGHTRRYEFDAVGNLRFFFEADNSQPTEYVFDALNQAVATIDPLGNRTEYEFDEVGNTIRVTDAGGETHRYTYDGLNRLVSETDTFGTQTHQLNAQGDVIRTVDRNGRRTDFAYNLSSDLISESWFDSDDNQIGGIDFVADDLGRVTQISSGQTSVTLSLTDDAAARLLGERVSVGETTVLITHDVDAAKRVTRTAARISGQVDQFVVNTYDYDANTEELFRVNQSGAFVSDKSVTFSHDADLPGVVSGITRASSGADVTTTISRNNRNLIESLDHNSGTDSLLELDYSYFVDGQLATATDETGTTNYTYDAANRLVAAEHSGAATDEVYAYDEAGNPIQGEFTVGEANRLLTDGLSDFEYDAEGNLVAATDQQSGAVVAYEWDHRNRLTRVISRDSNGTVLWQVDHEYDGLDRRVREVYSEADAGQTLQTIENRVFVYDGSELLAELLVDEVGDETIDVVYLTDATTDSTHAQDFGNEFHWLLHDRQESTRLIVDPQAAIVDQLTYNAYGVLQSSLGTDPASRILYTGGQFLPRLGLYYNRARFYDPSIGRFLSADPSGFLGMDPNLYRYAGGDPVNSFDPGGLRAQRVGSAEISSDASGSYQNRIASVWGQGAANPLGNGGREFQQSVAQNTVNINGAIARDLRPVVDVTGFYAALAVGVFSNLSTAPARSINELHQLGFQQLNRFGEFARRQSALIAQDLKAISLDSKLIARDAADAVSRHSTVDYVGTQLAHLSAVSAATMLTVADEFLQLGAAIADASVIEMEGYGLPSERAQRQRYSKLTEAFEQQGALKVAKMAFDAIVDLPNQITSGDAAAQAQAITAIGEFIAGPGVAAIGKSVGAGVVRAGGRVLRFAETRFPSVFGRRTPLDDVLAHFDAQNAARTSNSMSFEQLRELHKNADEVDFDAVSNQIDDFFRRPDVVEKLKGLTKAEIERLKDISKTIEVSRSLKEPIPPDHYTVIKPDAPGPEKYLFDPEEGLVQRIHDLHDPDVARRVYEAQGIAQDLQKLSSATLDPRLRKFANTLSQFMGKQGRIGLPNIWRKLNEVMEEAIVDVSNLTTGSVRDRLRQLTPEQAAEVIRRVDEKSVRNPVMTEITAQFAASPEYGGKLGINGAFERGSFGASLDQFLFRTRQVTDIVSGRTTPFSVLQGERFLFAWRTVSDLFKTPLGKGSDFDLNFTTETLKQYEALVAKESRRVFDKDEGGIVDKKIAGAKVIDQFYEFAKEQLDRRIVDANATNNAALRDELVSLRENFQKFEKESRKYDLVELYKQDVKEFRALVKKGLDSGSPIKKGAHGYVIVRGRGWANPFRSIPDTPLSAADGVRPQNLSFYDRLRPPYSRIERVQYLGHVFVGTSDRVVLDTNYFVPPPLAPSSPLIAAGIYGPVPLHSGVNFFDADNTHRHVACDESVFDSIDACGQWAIDQWSAALGTTPTTEIEFVVQDLAEPQLGTASILDRDKTGRPSQALIQIDLDANGLGWNAEGYDLASVLLHEVGHAFGFDASTGEFSRYVDADAQGLRYHVDGDILRLDRTGSELDALVHPDAVMAGSLRPRTQKSLSENDLEPLRRVWGVETPELTTTTELLSDSIAEPEFTSLPVVGETTETVGLTNADFAQTDPNASDFGWRTVGDVELADGVATISEDVGMISDLSQTFVVPSGVSTISFTLGGLAMDIGSSLNPNGNQIQPPEVFEVAILDTADGSSMMPALQTLAGGDALLNIQPDGTVYFAEGVRVGGANTSGDVLDLSQPIDVVISLPAEAARETATLMFDLVGFGEDASEVSVSELRLEAANGWQNPIDAFDVNDGGNASPLDALLVINELARVSVHDELTGKLFPITDDIGPPPYYDVTGDGFISPLDALRVINQLARQGEAEPIAHDAAITELLEE